MFTYHIGTTGQVDISTGDESFISCVEFTVYGFTGSMIPQTKQQTDGPGPFTPNYFNCAYVNADTGVAYAAGTAITADGRYIADTTGAYLSLNVTNAGDGDAWVVGKPFMGPAPSFSSGGGGGGAVTIADGADVAEGSTTDAAVGDATGTVNGHVRMVAKLASQGAADNSALSTFRLPVMGGTVATSAPTLTNGRQAPFSLDTAGNTRVLPAATEVHLGQIGGTTISVQPTVTVTAGAYSAGNCVGGLLTLTSAMRISGGSGAWAKLTMTDHANQKAPLDILLFKSSPAGTFTDHSAFPTMSTADNALVSCRISVAASDWVTIGGSAYLTKLVGPLPCVASGSANLYAAINTSGTPTYAATTDLTATFSFFCD